MENKKVLVKKQKCNQPMEKKRIFVLNGNTGMDLIHDKIKSKVLKSLILF